jgi:large subunit ribosomal protein L17
MRHRLKKIKLNRDTKHRKALFKNLLINLFEHSKITTTRAKAKAVQGLADGLIHKAKVDSVPVRRFVAQFFGTKELANRLVDEVAPTSMERTSGFTRITEQGVRRGDDALMVTLELVDEPKKAKKVIALEEKLKAKAVKKSTKKSAKTKTADKDEKQLQTADVQPAAKQDHETFASEHRSEQQNKFATPVKRDKIRKKI